MFNRKLKRELKEILDELNKFYKLQRQVDILEKLNAELQKRVEKLEKGEISEVSCDKV